MKQIGAEIGVNESRVSQLHARAIRRLRDALGQKRPDQLAAMRLALATLVCHKPKMMKAVVLPYKAPRRRSAPAAALLKLEEMRRAVAAR